MKRIISLLISLVLIVSFSAAAMAEETGNTALDDSLLTEDLESIMAQKKLDMILKLIELRDFAGSGTEYEQYVKRLEQLGVTTLEDSEAVQYLNDCGISLFQEENQIAGAIPSVESTENLKWDIVESTGYYYPELDSKFDIYFIMASPRNSNSNLRRSATTVSTNSIVKLLNMQADGWLQSALSAAAEELNLKDLFTVCDCILKLVSNADPAEITDVSMGSWTLNWIADSYMAYLYVRPHDSQADYKLSMSGCKVYVTYAYTQFVEVDDGTGYKVADFVTLHKSNVKYERSTFANYRYAVDAYRNDTIAYNIISFIDLEFFRENPNVNETVRIYPPDWRQNPTSYYWVISDPEEA